MFDLLNGYLTLSQKIFGNNKYNGSWNFGPDENHLTVKDIVYKFIKILNLKKKILIKKNKKIKETGLLSLKTDKAKNYLKWKPKLSNDQALKLIADWYKCYIDDKKSIEELCKKQIEDFFYDRRC